MRHRGRHGPRRARFASLPPSPPSYEAVLDHCGLPRACSSDSPPSRLKVTSQKRVLLLGFHMLHSGRPRARRARFASLPTRPPWMKAVEAPVRPPPGPAAPTHPPRFVRALQRGSAFRVFKLWPLPVQNTGSESPVSNFLQSPKQAIVSDFPKTSENTPQGPSFSER